MRILLFARESLETSGLFFCLTRQLALRAATTARCFASHPVAHRFGLTLQTLILLLLTRRQLTEPLERLVHFLRSSRRGLLLHRLVLIAHAVVLELEEVGEILGALTAATASPAPALLLLLLHLHVAVDRVGALQVAERALLRRERRAAVALAEVLFGGLHLLARAHEELADLREGGVAAGESALEQSLREGLHLFAQTSLRDRQRGDVLVALLLRARRAVAQPVVRAGDDITLAFHEIAR